MLTLLFSLRDCFRARAFLQAEILALRLQLLVLQGSNRGHKLRLGWADRVLWVWLSRLWNDWRSALLLVKPETTLRVTCCATATARTVRSSVRRRNGWAFGKSWQHRDHRGKIPLRNCRPQSMWG